jgi:hypothetical protein
VQDGDCNDCTPYMNPGAFDFFDGIDEDCNQIVDDEPTQCDVGIGEDAVDAMDAAKSFGLCRQTTADAKGTAKTWGVISARYVYPDGTTASKAPKDMFNCIGGGEGQPPNPKSHGVLTAFGTNVKPRHGESMVALSSGIARSGAVEDSPGGAKMCTHSGMPAGFPVASTNCPNHSVDKSGEAYDGIALELVIRVPTNARSLFYDFNFFAYEFPSFVCGQYNDYFVAVLQPHHQGSGPNDNISFDSQGNPVSVNNALLEVCDPGVYGGKTFACPFGNAELTKTGFEGKGATGWLQTNASVTPGEVITLRYAIWDSGDELYDATVLLDHFHWDLAEIPPSTVRPPK